MASPCTASVLTTQTGVLWWDPRLLHASDEGIVGSVGLGALIVLGQVLLGRFACQSEKSGTTTRPDVIAAHDSHVALLPWMVGMRAPP